MSDVILVTGATGFIGRSLISALKRIGCEVRSLSSREGDLADPPLKAESDVAHVYHLAARSFVPDSWTDTHSFYRTNVLGTVSVLEFCRHTGASLTFVSSYIYGHPECLPIPEDHPLKPTNPYSHTKMMGEELVRYYSARFDVRATIVRPFNIYGPGQHPSFLIPVVLRQAVSPDTDVIEVADHRPRRDYLYIEDFVELLVGARGRSGAVWNAGSGSSVSVAELVEIVNSLLRKPKRLVSRAQERTAEIMDVVADISRVRRDLGWVPATGLVAGLRRTMDLFKH
jgi:nucleoside-diphosphate-sugar epimerase